MIAASLLRSLRVLLLDRCGAAAVEFAIVLPVFLLLVLGTMEFGRLYWIQVTLQDGADTAARAAMITKYSSGAATTLQNICNARIQALGVSSSSCVATVPSGNTAVTITASESFAFLFGALPKGTINLKGTTSAPFGS